MTPPVAAPLAFDLDAPYGLEAPRKRGALLEALNGLTRWHRDGCAAYRNAVDAVYGEGDAASLEELPFLPVRLFKLLDLASVPRGTIVKTLVSSGTGLHAPSRIHLDRETALRQSRVLAAVIASFIGRQRRPMVIVDDAGVVRGHGTHTARAAGILGFSVFGRDPVYVLDADLRLDAPRLRAFLERHRGEPLLVFGFTAVVWQGLCQQAAARGESFDLGDDTVLFHGGGWKRLADQQVGNAQFKATLRERFGIGHVHNYYGMVEQVGAIHVECEHGHLHSPVFSDVLVRDPVTLEPLPHGSPGVLQVLSALPLSYPGHSLLTEDLGVVHGEDDCLCGRRGRHFEVLGRLPQSELRGCSDTRVMP